MELLEVTELTCLFSTKSQKCDGALFCSFVLSIAPFEEDWCSSRGQQEALLAEVTLAVGGLVADEAIVGIC